VDDAELEQIAAELQRPQSLSGAHALWNRVATLRASEAALLAARLGWLRAGERAGHDAADSADAEAA
jgi:hypothetical protein